MPAPPSINSYTKFANHGMTDSGNSFYSDRYYADNNVPDHDDGKLSELAAWMCNQNDECRGFMRRRGNWEMWFHLTGEHGGSTTVPHQFVAGDTLDTYVKSDQPARKANNPDTSDPSILSNPKTKIVFNNANDNFNTGGAVGSWNSGHPRWTSLPDNPPLQIGYNNINEITVPLGWRFLDGDNGWASGQSGCCHNSILTGDNIKRNGWGHYQDGILVENRGFDVLAHWDDMVSLGVDPDDAKRIKERWCNAVTSIQTLSDNASKCQGAYNDMHSGQGAAMYNQKLLTLCDVNGSWNTQAACKTAVHDAIANGDTNSGQGLTMLQKYCRGGDGSDPKGIGAGRSTTGLGSQLCGCLNARDFGIISDPPSANCYTYPNMAGCTQVVAKTQGVVNYSTPAGVVAFNSAVSDLGKLATDCTTARSACNSAGCVIPYNPNAMNVTEIINICNMISNQGLAQNSPVRQTCNIANTITTPGPAGTPPVTTGNTPGALGSSPSSPPGSTSSPDTGSNTKWYYIGGGVAGFVCLCLFCLIIILLVSG